MIFTNQLTKLASYDKIVIFELITLIYIPLVFLYLIRGYKIKYFNINKKLEKIKWFKKIEILENISTIERFENNEKAIEHGNKIYKNKFKNNKMIKEIEKLFDSKMVHIIYKKILIFQLQHKFNIQTTINNIKNNYDKIIYFPDKFNKIKNCKYIILICLLPIWIRININQIITNEKKEHYKIGIRIYNSDISFYRKYRRIDFLLDHKKINKNNTLFCLETDISNDYKKKLKEKDYNFIKLKNLLLKVDKNFLKNTLNYKFVFRCFKISLLCLTTPFFKSSLLLLNQYLLWKRFINKYQLDHYIAYNDFSRINHVARNIILSQNNIQTWYYEQSCHFWDTFIPPNTKLKMIEPEFLYLYYDNLISWSDKTTRTFKKHQVFTNYHNLGVLWSEHVKKISDGKLQSDLDNIRKNINNKKIIGVFDTSFGLDPPLKADDMILFINGIFKLLNDNSNIYVIFKKKKDMDTILKNYSDEYKSRIKLSYENLKLHNRCYSTYNTFETSKIIAISDLVISACFSSTTVESLGARKKAIYFDSSNKLKNYYYDQFPNLVAHGYEELKNLVQYWLYDITHEEFDNYLETYIKGELDAYIDGKAITRFRNLLINKNSIKESK